MTQGDSPEKANANRHFKAGEKAENTTVAAKGITAARVKADTDKTTRLRAARLAKEKAEPAPAKKTRRKKDAAQPE